METIYHILLSSWETLPRKMVKIENCETIPPSWDFLISFSNNSGLLFKLVLLAIEFLTVIPREHARTEDSSLAQTYSYNLKDIHWMDVLSNEIFSQNLKHRRLCIYSMTRTTYVSFRAQKEIKDKTIHEELLLFFLLNYLLYFL